MFKKTLLLSGIALCLLGANDASAMRRSSVRHPMAAPKSTDPKEQAELRKQLEELHQKRFEESNAKVEAQRAEKLELAKRGASIPTPIKVVDPSARVDEHAKVELKNEYMAIVDKVSEGDEGKKAALMEVLTDKEIDELVTKALTALANEDSNYESYENAMLQKVTDSYTNEQANSLSEFIEEYKKAIVGGKSFFSKHWGKVTVGTIGALITGLYFGLKK